MPKLQLKEPEAISNALPRASTGKISGFLRIYYKLLQKLKRNKKYDRTTASVCARFNLRCMRIIKNHDSPPIYLDAIRTRLLPDYHAANCEVAKECGKYPLTSTFKEILILYTKMELEFGPTDANNRIIKTLMNIFQDIADFDEHVEDMICVAVVATVQILLCIDGYQITRNDLLKKLAIKLGSTILSEIFQTCQGKNEYESKKVIPMDHPDIQKIRKAVEVFNSWFPSCIEVEDDEDEEYVEYGQAVPSNDEIRAIKPKVEIKEEPTIVETMDLTGDRPKVSKRWKVQTNMRKECNRKAYGVSTVTPVKKVVDKAKTCSTSSPRLVSSSSNTVIFCDEDDDEVTIIGTSREQSSVVTTSVPKKIIESRTSVPICDEKTEQLESSNNLSITRNAADSNINPTSDQESPSEKPLNEEVCHLNRVPQSSVAIEIDNSAIKTHDVIVTEEIIDLSEERETPRPEKEDKTVKNNFIKEDKIKSKASEKCHLEQIDQLMSNVPISITEKTADVIQENISIEKSKKELVCPGIQKPATAEKAAVTEEKNSSKTPATEIENTSIETPKENQVTTIVVDVDKSIQEHSTKSSVEEEREKSKGKKSKLIEVQKNQPIVSQKMEMPKTITDTTTVVEKSNSDQEHIKTLEIKVMESTPTELENSEADLLKESEKSAHPLRKPVESHKVDDTFQISKERTLKLKREDSIFTQSEVKNSKKATDLRNENDKLEKPSESLSHKIDDSIKNSNKNTLEIKQIESSSTGIKNQQVRKSKKISDSFKESEKSLRTPVDSHKIDDAVKNSEEKTLHAKEMETTLAEIENREVKNSKEISGLLKDNEKPSHSLRTTVESHKVDDIVKKPEEKALDMKEMKSIPSEIENCKVENSKKTSDLFKQSGKSKRSSYSLRTPAERHKVEDIVEPSKKRSLETKHMESTSVEIENNEEKKTSDLLKESEETRKLSHFLKAPVKIHKVDDVEKNSKEKTLERNETEITSAEIENHQVNNSKKTSALLKESDKPSHSLRSHKVVDTVKNSEEIVAVLKQLTELQTVGVGKHKEVSVSDLKDTEKSGKADNSDQSTKISEDQKQIIEVSKKSEKTIVTVDEKITKTVDLENTELTQTASETKKTEKNLDTTQIQAETTEIVSVTKSNEEKIALSKKSAFSLKQHQTREETVIEVKSGNNEVNKMKATTEIKACTSSRKTHNKNQTENDKNTLADDGLISLSEEVIPDVQFHFEIAHNEKQEVKIHSTEKSETFPKELTVESTSNQETPLTETVTTVTNILPVDTEEGDSQESADTVSSSDQTLSELKLTLQKQQCLKLEEKPCKSDSYREKSSSAKRSPSEKNSKSRSRDRDVDKRRDRSDSVKRDRCLPKKRRRSRSPLRHSSRELDSKRRRGIDQDREQRKSPCSRKRKADTSSRQYSRRDSTNYRETRSSNSSRRSSLRSGKETYSKQSEDERRKENSSFLGKSEDLKKVPKEAPTTKSDGDGYLSDVSDEPLPSESDDEKDNAKGRESERWKENNYQNSSSRRAKSFDILSTSRFPSKPKRSSTVDRTIYSRTSFYDERKGRRNSSDRKNNKSSSPRRYSRSPSQNPAEKSFSNNRKKETPQETKSNKNQSLKSTSNSSNQKPKQESKSKSQHSEPCVTIVEQIVLEPSEQLNKNTVEPVKPLPRRSRRLSAMYSTNCKTDEPVSTNVDKLDVSKTDEAAEESANSQEIHEAVSVFYDKRSKEADTPNSMEVPKKLSDETNEEKQPDIVEQKPSTTTFHSPTETIVDPTLSLEDAVAGTSHESTDSTGFPQICNTDIIFPTETPKSSTCTSANTSLSTEGTEGLHMLASTAIEKEVNESVVQPSSLLDEDISQSFKINYVHQDVKSLKTKHIDSNTSDDSDNGGLTIDASTPGRSDENSRSPHPSVDETPKSTKTTDHSIMTILTKDRSPEEVQKKKQASMYLKQKEKNFAVDLSQNNHTNPPIGYSRGEPFKVRTKAERKQEQMPSIEDNKVPTPNLLSPSSRKRKGQTPNKRIPNRRCQEIVVTSTADNIIAGIPNKKSRLSCENPVQTRSGKMQTKPILQNKIFKIEHVSKVLEAIRVCQPNDTKPADQDAAKEISTTDLSTSIDQNKAEAKEETVVEPTPLPVERNLTTMPLKKRETRKSFDGPSTTNEISNALQPKEDDIPLATSTPNTRNRLAKKPTQCCRRSARQAQKCGSYEELQLNFDVMSESEETSSKVESGPITKRRRRKSKSKTVSETEDVVTTVEEDLKHKEVTCESVQEPSQIFPLASEMKKDEKEENKQELVKSREGTKIVDPVVRTMEKPLDSNITIKQKTSNSKSVAEIDDVVMSVENEKLLKPSQTESKEDNSLKEELKHKKVTCRSVQEPSKIFPLASEAKKEEKGEARSSTNNKQELVKSIKVSADDPVVKTIEKSLPLNSNITTKPKTSNSKPVSEVEDVVKSVENEKLLKPQRESKEDNSLKEELKHKKVACRSVQKPSNIFPLASEAKKEEKGETKSSTNNKQELMKSMKVSADDPVAKTIEKSLPLDLNITTKPKTSNSKPVSEIEDVVKSVENEKLLKHQKESKEDNSLKEELKHKKVACKSVQKPSNIFPLASEAKKAEKGETKSSTNNKQELLKSMEVSADIKIVDDPVVKTMEKPLPLNSNITTKPKTSNSKPVSGIEDVVKSVENEKLLKPEKESKVDNSLKEELKHKKVTCKSVQKPSTIFPLASEAKEGEKGETKSSTNNKQELVKSMELSADTKIVDNYDSVKTMVKPLPLNSNTAKQKISSSKPVAETEDVVMSIEDKELLKPIQEKLKGDNSFKEELKHKKVTRKSVQKPSTIFPLPSETKKDEKEATKSCTNSEQERTKKIDVPVNTTVVNSHCSNVKSIAKPRFNVNITFKHDNAQLKQASSSSEAGKPEKEGKGTSTNNKQEHTLKLMGVPAGSKLDVRGDRHGLVFNSIEKPPSFNSKIPAASEHKEMGADNVESSKQNANRVADSKKSAVGNKIAMNVVNNQKNELITAPKQNTKKFHFKLISVDKIVNSAKKNVECPQSTVEKFTADNCGIPKNKKIGIAYRRPSQDFNKNLSQGYKGPAVVVQNIALDEVEMQRHVDFIINKVAVEKCDANQVVAAKEQTANVTTPSTVSADDYFKDLEVENKTSCDSVKNVQNDQTQTLAVKDATFIPDTQTTETPHTEKEPVEPFVDVEITDDNKKVDVPVPQVHEIAATNMLFDLSSGGIQELLPSLCSALSTAASLIKPVDTLANTTTMFYSGSESVLGGGDPLCQLDKVVVSSNPTPIPISCEPSCSQNTASTSIGLDGYVKSTTSSEFDTSEAAEQHDFANESFEATTAASDDVDSEHNYLGPFMGPNQQQKTSNDDLSTITEEKSKTEDSSPVDTVVPPLPSFVNDILIENNQGLGGTDQVPITETASETQTELKINNTLDSSTFPPESVPPINEFFAGNDEVKHVNENEICQLPNEKELQALLSKGGLLNCMESEQDEIGYPIDTTAAFFTQDSMYNTESMVSTLQTEFKRIYLREYSKRKCYSGFENCETPMKKQKTSDCEVGPPIDSESMIDQLLEVIEKTKIENEGLDVDDKCNEEIVVANRFSTSSPPPTLVKYDASSPRIENQSENLQTISGQYEQNVQTDAPTETVIAEIPKLERYDVTPRPQSKANQSPQVESLEGTSSSESNLEEATPNPTIEIVFPGSIDLLREENHSNPTIAAAANQSPAKFEISLPALEEDDCDNVPYLGEEVEVTLVKPVTKVTTQINKSSDTVIFKNSSLTHARVKPCLRSQSKTPEKPSSTKNADDNLGYYMRRKSQCARPPTSTKRTRRKNLPEPHETTSKSENNAQATLVGSDGKPDVFAESSLKFDAWLLEQKRQEEQQQSLAGMEMNSDAAFDALSKSKVNNIPHKTYDVHRRSNPESTTLDKIVDDSDKDGFVEQNQKQSTRNGVTQNYGTPATASASCQKINIENPPCPSSSGVPQFNYPRSSSERVKNENKSPRIPDVLWKYTKPVIGSKSAPEDTSWIDQIEQERDIKTRLKTDEKVKFKPSTENNKKT